MRKYDDNFMKSGSIAIVDSKDIAGEKIANEDINDSPIPHSVRKMMATIRSVLSKKFWSPLSYVAYFIAYHCLLDCGASHAKLTLESEVECHRWKLKTVYQASILKS